MYSFSFTLSSSFQNLGALLTSAGATSVVNPVSMQAGFFRNTSTTLKMYVASGYNTAPTGLIGGIDPGASLNFDEGFNANLCWVKSVSGTPQMDFFVGSQGLTIGNVSGALPAMAIATRKYAVYDNFDRANSLLNDSTSTSGQRWQVLGAGATTASIINGAVNSTDNIYAYLNYGSQISRLEGAFSYTLDSTHDPFTATEEVVLIADASYANSLQNILHLQLRPRTWSLEKRVANGAFVGIANGTYNLRTDGTIYNAVMEISGNTVTVTTPDGIQTSVTDSDISLMGTLQYGVYQITGTVTGFTPRWHLATIGESNAKALVASGTGSSMTDITALQGTGVTTKQWSHLTLTGGAGWYRVATGASREGFAIIGQVSISADSVTGGLASEAIFNLAGKSDGLSIISQEYSHNSEFVIQKVRLSRNSGTNSVALDIYLTLATSTTVDIEFDGFFTPTVNPSVGATPLATESIIFTFDSSANSARNLLGFSNTLKWRSVSATLTGGTGYYRIATADILTTFIMTGRVKVAAVDPITTYTNVFEIKCASLSTTVAPVLVEDLSLAVVAHAISKVRLSTTTGSNLIALDLFLPPGGPGNVNVYIEFIGYFVPIAAPVVGATVGSTGSTEITLS